ncbi:MAG: response regulator transcription factor, partial [Ruthenibacterium sp.]
TILAHDGEAAVKAFEAEKPALLLLDIMMPRMDGWEVCRKVRAVDNTPVIMLTAKGETFDKVLGLELGADDYMVKPFDAKEVVARIKAVLRRCALTENAKQVEGVISYDKLSVDLSRYELKIDGKVVEAPPKELELLYFLSSHPNRVFTRDQLLDEVWGFEYYGDSRTIDVHVKRLREKLENASEQWTLKTVWGVGYKFEVKE